MSKTLSLRSLLGSTSLPRNEAHILMAHVLDKHYQLPRSTLISRDEMELSPSASEEWRTLESRRLNGEPVAYLVGKRGFHKIELQVAPGVLIPRPETELLVDIALQEIKRIENSIPSPKILDLGTGSGAIALAIANVASNAQVIATDQSAEALAIAKLNAKSLGLETRVEFAPGSWYQALKENDIFDIILSNPPYIPNHERLPQEVIGFEPEMALRGGAGDGMDVPKLFISAAARLLKPGGYFIMEHHETQRELVKNALQSEFKNIQNISDLTGRDRFTSGIKS